MRLGSGQLYAHASAQEANHLAQLSPGGARLELRNPIVPQVGSGLALIWGSK